MGDHVRLVQLAQLSRSLAQRQAGAAQGAHAVLHAGTLQVVLAAQLATLGSSVARAKAASSRQAGRARVLPHLAALAAGCEHRMNSIG